MATDRPYRILAVDGGGIRGIIPALLLAEIERAAKRPVAELFDLIAGTSTGALITLGLTVGDRQPDWSAADIAELYANEGPDIFTRSQARTLATSAFQRPHDEQPFVDLLYDYFATYRLSGALTEVLVPTYDLHARAPFFFSSRAARSDEQSDYLVADVARAASAAPTYFRPAEGCAGLGRKTEHARAHRRRRLREQPLRSAPWWKPAPSSQLGSCSSCRLEPETRERHSTPRR